MSYSATAIANYFIKKSKETGKPVSNMHLQKMIFFAHAAYMKQTRKPLFLDPVVAWKHGPVVEQIYHDLKQYGNGVVTAEIVVAEPAEGKNGLSYRFVTPAIRQDDTEVRDYLNQVWDALCGVETWRLRALSHAKDGAWYKTLAERGIAPYDDDDGKIPRNLTILDDVIMECGR